MILGALLACVGAPPDFDPTLAEGLQTNLDRQRVLVGAPGATQAVLFDGHLWTGASGLADIALERAVVPEDRFRVGSITKTFVAAAVLQLWEEGALDLDAPLAVVLPDAPWADQVTPRQLLAHTAGYPDYVSDPRFLAGLADPWDPWDLLALISDEELLYVPGEGYRYANTHYVLLGLAIEAVTGQPYHAVLRERFLDPLGLEDTFLPSGEGDPGGMARGYLGDVGAYDDVTDGMDPSAPWASGEMVSDVDDLLRWGEALYGGEVLSPASLREMTTEVEVPGSGGTGYGLGCHIEEVLGAVTWGHSGSTQGYQSRLRVMTPPDGPPVVVATLVNNFLSEADQVDIGAWAVVLAPELERVSP